MDWTVLAVAVLGVAGTAAGTVLAPTIAARQSQRTWLRQRRVELYSDALLHGEAGLRLTRRVVDPDRLDEPYARGGLAEMVPSDLVSARMRLYADPPVERAWRDFVEASEGLDWIIQEEYHGQPDFSLSSDDPCVVRLASAAAQLAEVCRRQVIGR